MSPTFFLSIVPSSQPSCSLKSAPKNQQSCAELNYKVIIAYTPDGDEDYTYFGNGDCICDKCVCDVGWRGPYCSQLDLLPAKKDAKGIDMNGGYPTQLLGVVLPFLILSRSKTALDSYSSTIDPYTYWERVPDDNIVSEDPYGGSHPWKFTVDASKDSFPNEGNKISSS